MKVAATLYDRIRVASEAVIEQLDATGAEVAIVLGSGLAEAARATFGKPLREAIYAGLPGPSYETPAEVRMLRTLGAGLVGMSTIHEVIAGRHSGLRVLGLSLVANLAAGVKPTPLSHEDVT